MAASSPPPISSAALSPPTELCCSTVLQPSATPRSQVPAISPLLLPSLGQVALSPVRPHQTPYSLLAPRLTSPATATSLASALSICPPARPPCPGRTTPSPSSPAPFSIFLPAASSSSIRTAA